MRLASGRASEIRTGRLDKEEFQVSSLSNRKLLTIFHHNVQGLTSKFCKLEGLVHSLEPLVVCLTEHWLTIENITQIKIKNYETVSYFCRDQHIRGGSLILVKENLVPYIKKIEVCSKEFSFECSAVTLENFNLVIAVIYRSQQGPYDIFLEHMKDFLDNIRHIYKKKILICGDFNIDFLVDDTCKERSRSLLKTYNMDYVINKPTRITAHSKTAIDNIFTNIRDITYNIINGISDHTSQLILIQSGQTIGDTHTTHVFRNYSVKNKQKFTTKLSEESWCEVYNNNTTDEKFNSFYNILQNTFYACFNKITLKTNNKQKKGWVTRDIRTLSRRKRQILSEIQQSDANLILKKRFLTYYKNK